MSIDVADKSRIMKQNKAFMIASLGKDATLSLNAMIDEEIAKGVPRLNGDNNKKELDKSKINSWEYTYNSSARNLVRMWWLTKFLTKLLDNLINNQQMTLVSACQDAYTTGFADHHPWLVRKGAGLAMMAAGSKESLMGKWQVQSVLRAAPMHSYEELLRCNAIPMELAMQCNESGTWDEVFF